MIVLSKITDGLVSTDSICQEYSVTRNTVYLWRKNKGCPHTINKLTGEVRFDPEEVKQWYESNLKKINGK